LDPLALVDPVSFTPPPPPDIATLSLHDALPIFYIHLDAHNDLSPGIYPYQSRMLRTDWWPADAGNNANLLDHFSRWAYEDPANNLAKAPLTIVFREPDLQLFEIGLPEVAAAGQTIPITYTVVAGGTRSPREASWVDRIFLSRDPSLDNRD